jgi:hypothetical protein
VNLKFQDRDLNAGTEGRRKKTYEGREKKSKAKRERGGRAAVYRNETGAHKDGLVVALVVLLWL